MDTLFSKHTVDICCCFPYLYLYYLNDIITYTAWPIYKQILCVLHFPGCLALGEWSYHRDYLGCEDLIYTVSSVYSCHLFLISSVSVTSIPFLSFIEPIFAWNVPLVSLILLKRWLAFPILLFSSISCTDHWGRLPYLSLLFFGILHSNGISFIFSLPFTFLWTSLVAQMVKCMSTMRETWVQALGQEDLLEKEMTTHSSILAWKIPWTRACQTPLCVGFPRQEYWSGLPFPSPGDLPDPGLEPVSPALSGRFFTIEPPGKPFIVIS